MASRYHTTIRLTLSEAEAFYEMLARYAPRDELVQCRRARVQTMISLSKTIAHASRLRADHEDRHPKNIPSVFTERTP